ncbi:MAG: DNA-binding response regulator [Desulfobacteraceae bacterium]|nr:MAG: DNA-binding response regulator [Desulfobacteraceae bacterium]
MINLLIVEDEPQLVGILEYLFKDEGYEVFKAYSAEEAIKSLKTRGIDLVLLDIMLPQMDGFQLCAYLKKNTVIPVIILSAKKEDEDKIRGLELGAADYITKPFNHKELILRVKKVVEARVHKKELSIGKMNIHSATREVFIAGTGIELTPIEFNLLLLMAEKKGRVLSWESIFDAVWGYKKWEGAKEIVKITIYRLRQKIERDPSHPEYLLTIRGIGYKMNDFSKM